MHLSRQIVQELALRLGEPAVERWRFPMSEEEFRRLTQHISQGRAHDVTPLICRGEEVVVVRKHHYPPGAYRVPSGGVDPEEAFLDGALREAHEETGLTVEVQRYLLRVHVVFTLGAEEAQWTTHVMRARPLAGEVRPVDTGEIEEARWMEWEELLRKVNPILVSTGLGGLAYRARLHQKSRELLPAL